ncbi:hypothetical protein V8E36_007224 [Tilletia maclaganii]
MDVSPLASRPPSSSPAPPPPPPLSHLHSASSTGAAAAAGREDGLADLANNGSTSIAPAGAGAGRDSAAAQHGHITTAPAAAASDVLGLRTVPGGRRPSGMKQLAFSQATAPDGASAAAAASPTTMPTSNAHASSNGLDVDSAAPPAASASSTSSSTVSNGMSGQPAENPYIKGLAAIAQPIAVPAGDQHQPQQQQQYGGLQVGESSSSVVKQEFSDVEMHDAEEYEARRLLSESVEFLQPASIRQRFETALRSDQKRALMPDYWTPFTDTHDVISRLLPYHIWNVPDEDLKWALAPPPGEARLREELIARREAAARTRGKGKQRAVEDSEAVAEAGGAAPSHGGAMDCSDEGRTRKKRRLTESTAAASSSAPNSPPHSAKAPDRDKSETAAEDLELALLGERYAFPSLSLAMSYYWAGLSIQKRMEELIARAEGGAARPYHNPAPLSFESIAKADAVEEQEVLAAPAQNLDVSLEYLERLAYEDEKAEYGRVLVEWRTAQGQLERLQRVLIAAQAPPPTPVPVRAPQLYRNPAPAPRPHSYPAAAPQSSATAQANQPAPRSAQQGPASAAPARPLHQSQVPSGTINPAIPSNPIPLLIPLANLSQLLAMNINPAPAPHVGPAFRKAIIDKPDLQQNPHSLLLAAERVARNARIRRAQLSEGLQPGNPVVPALQAELDALDQLSVAPRVAPPDQAEPALLLGISISAAAMQANRFPGPEEMAPPATVMLHISVVLSKLSATQLSSLAALMQSLQAHAQAQTEAQGPGSAAAQGPGGPARPAQAATPQQQARMAGSSQVSSPAPSQRPASHGPNVASAATSRLPAAANVDTTTTSSSASPRPSSAHPLPPGMSTPVKKEVVEPSLAEPVRAGVVVKKEVDG